MNLDDQIIQLLTATHAIGVVGLSADAGRASYGVADYMRAAGYTIVPINPHVRSVLGLTAYPDLASAAKDFTIDLVNVFRRSEYVPDIVEDAIAIGAPAIWLQLGVVHAAAAQRAREAGLIVIADRCLKIDHSRLMSNEEKW